MEDNIELRSEKVRNIIGQIPPRVIRVGISVIFLIIAGLLVGSYFFKYDYVVKTTALISQHNDTTVIQLTIPAVEKDKIKKGNKVILYIDNTQSVYNQNIITEIQTLPHTLQIQNKKVFFVADIYITQSLKTAKNDKIKILSPTEVRAEIITEKISFFQRIIEPMTDIFQNKKRE